MKILTETANLFETTFNLMPKNMVLTDSSLKIIHVNNTFLESFNRHQAEVVGQDLLNFLSIDLVEEDRIRQYLRSNVKRTRPLRFEAFIRTDSKTNLYAIIDTRFIQYQGNPVAIMEINDISVHKKNEENLRSAEEKILGFPDNANDLILSISPDGSILFANQKWLHTLGYRQDELADLNIADILHEDRVPYVFNILARVKCGEKFGYIETIFNTKDRREIFVEGTIDGQFEFGKFIGLKGIFKDITNRKMLEVTYSRLIKNFPQPIYIIQKNQFKFVNPSFQNMTGYSEKELLAMQSLGLVHPEDMAFVRKNAIRMLKANRPSNYEFRMLKKSGEVRWVMETVISIPYEGGQATLGTLVDLTERKLVEGALEEAKNRYQTLFNCASDAIYLTDMDHRFLEVNDTACHLFEYNRAELLKMTVDKIVSPRYKESFAREVRELQDKGSIIAESENISRSGKLIPMEVNSRLVDYEKKKVDMVISRNITERKQVENLRKRTEARLESLVKMSECKSGSIDAILFASLAETIKLTDSKLGYICRFDEKTHEFTCNIWSEELLKIFGSRTDKQVYPLENAGLMGEVVRQRKPVFFNYQQAPSLLINGYPEGRYQLERVLCIPILHKTEIIAVVNVANKEGDYDVNDIQQIVLFMNSVQNIIDRWYVEEALRESEYRYRQLIEMAQDAIIIINQEGKAVMANPAACEMFGYSEKEFCGLAISDTYLPEDQAVLAERLEQLRNNRTLRYERQARRKDGQAFPVEAYFSPLSQGLFQDVLRDITVRKKLEREIQSSEQKYRLLVENQTDLVVEIDAGGTFLFVNPAFTKLMGKSKEVLIGSTMLSLIHSDDRGRTVITTANTAPCYYECRMQTQAGWRWVAWTENAVVDNQGKLTALTCIGRDITESKQAKEELEKANQQLRELDKLKDNFLSTVSHELRTPLTSIKSFAEILLNYDEDRETQKEFLGIINEESDRLTRLINEVLDLNKIQAGRMTWKNEELSVGEAIRSAGSAARPLLDKAQLQLLIEVAPDLPTVIMDKDRLIQVITNLLGNAIKFTPEDGRIIIQASTENSLVKVSVRDTGIGIAPENYHKIFENFGQVGDVLKDRPKGTGLGLPICKRIIENYGGKIWVESVLGQGTNFLVTLPAAGQKNTT